MTKSRQYIHRTEEEFAYSFCRRAAKMLEIRKEQGNILLKEDKNQFLNREKSDILRKVSYKSLLYVLYVIMVIQPS